MQVRVPIWKAMLLHFNVNDLPSSAWTAQQLTEALPFCNPPRYLLRDREHLRRAIPKAGYRVGPGTEAHRRPIALAKSRGRC